MMSLIDKFTIVAAISTFLLFVIALFHNVIKDFIRRPKLHFELEYSPPHCHRVKTRGQMFSYYFALKVWNRKGTKAEDVEITLLELSRKIGSKWESINTFSPDSLKWRLTDRAILPTLNPHTYKHCNLGFIYDPAFRTLNHPDIQKQMASDPNVKLAYEEFYKSENIPDSKVSDDETIFHVQVENPSTNLPHLLGPGTYRLKLVASCSNGKPVTQEYLLELKGKWFENEDRMLNEGILVSKA